MEAGGRWFTLESQDHFNKEEKMSGVYGHSDKGNCYPTRQLVQEAVGDLKAPEDANQYSVIELEGEKNKKTYLILPEQFVSRVWKIAHEKQLTGNLVTLASSDTSAESVARQAFAVTSGLEEVDVIDWRQQKLSAAQSTHFNQAELSGAQFVSVPDVGAQPPAAAPEVKRNWFQRLFDGFRSFFISR